MNSFKSLKEYCKGLAENHLLLDGNFVHGGVSKLRADVLSKMNYPLMWLETPFIEINSSVSAVFTKKKSAIVILGQMNVLNESEEQQDDKLDMLEGIALDIITKLAKDGRDGIHKIDISECDLDPIDPLLVDNCIGWRFEFSLTNPINMCFNPNNWKP
jgi:hypothetical protein